MSHRNHPNRIPALVLLSAALFFSGCGGDETSAPLSEDPPIDEQPPLAPSGLVLDIEGVTKFSFSWQANTEPDLAGYRVYLYDPDPSRPSAYRCLTGEGLLSNPSMTITGETGVTYSLKVSAVDLGRKESAWSETFVYTFQAPSDEQQAGTVGGGGENPLNDMPGGGGDVRDLPMDLPVRK